MNSDGSTIIKMVLSFFGCALVYLGVIELYYFSIQNPVEIETWVEIGQETLLAVSAVLMFGAARKAPRWRGGLLLIAGFITALFIRELDAYFDEISHGFWKYILIAFLVVLSAFVKKASWRTIVPGIASWARTRAGALMVVGLAMLLVYSRLYGYKGLWATVAASMGADGAQPMSWEGFKSLGEEAAEIVAYTLVFFSCVLYRFELKGLQSENKFIK